MTLLLKQLFAFLKLLNSDTGTNSLALGLSLGLFLGFAPFFSLQTLLVLLIVTFFRIQLGAAFLSAFFFKFVAWTIDTPADKFGQLILENESFRSLFTSMHNMPLVPFTRFNNSIVMGSFVVAMILLIPSFLFFKYLIVKYRTHIVARFKSSKAWKAFLATPIYNWYCKYNDFYGA